MMSKDPEAQTSQSNEETSSQGDPSSPSSATATAAQSHRQQQSKHKFRHEIKSKSSLPPIQECTLAECIAFLRLENSPTGSRDAGEGAASTQEEPVSNECSSTIGAGAGSDPPSSPLDCFLTGALKNHQHRLFILKLERDFSQFLDRASPESLELPWINSFYRMMIHRVANYFQLERRIDTAQKTITLYRTDQSALPAFRFVDLMQQDEVEEEAVAPAPAPAPTLAPAPATTPIKVLKRCPPRPATVCGGRSSSSSRVEESRRSTVSIKEREEAYAKARARIFQGTEERSHSRSPSSSSSSSHSRTRSRSNTGDITEESNVDETLVTGSDQGPDFMTSPTPQGPSTPCHSHDGPFLHHRGRYSESSEPGYPPPQQLQCSEPLYRDPSRRTSAPSLGTHGIHRQVVPGARHFVQGSDGVIRYDPTIDTSPQQPPIPHHTSGNPSKRQSYSHQGQEQYTHPRETQYSHQLQCHPDQYPLHHPGHHHDQACPLVRQHSAPEMYMTKSQQDHVMCPFVQQHLQQHHSHHGIPQRPILLHHVVPPQHLCPPPHRPPPRQATYPVYGDITRPSLQQTHHQGPQLQGHHGAYVMDPTYPCPYMHHDRYSPDMGSPPLVLTGCVPHPHSPHSTHPRPVSPMHAQGGAGLSSRARLPSTRGGGPGGGGGIQLPSYPVYDVDKRPPKSTELYDPKNPGRKSRG